MPEDTSTTSISGEEDVPRSLSDKLDKLGVNLDEIEKVQNVYPSKITDYYLSLIYEKNDPIYRQAIPKIEELTDSTNIEDPLEEEKHSPVKYLVHKYPDRCLLLVSNECAMYCRFCTRKRKVGKTDQIPMEAIGEAIKYIKAHEEIRDVIISGGDPLVRTNEELHMIICLLKLIPHVEIIRIGTRMPCVQPSRINKELVDMLQKHSPIFMNIHFNHPREITESVIKACDMLRSAGVILGSQTVLLKGVNDTPEIMKELMQKLIKHGIKPYYLYNCDTVKGADHFRTSIKNGQNIIKYINESTSGFCTPNFVIDSKIGKVPVDSDHVIFLENNEVLLKYKGSHCEYLDKT